MAAPVRLEEEVFTDPAVDALAALIGLSDRDSAVGKLARLFSWQTEKYTDDRPTYAVPRAVLIGIFGARGPEAMVESGLATLQADGFYRIHGADKPNGRTPGKTRINWLWLEHKAQSERARKRSRGPDSSPGMSPAEPEACREHAGDNPQTCSLISDLLSPSGDHTHTARARDLGTPDPQHIPPPAGDMHARVAEEIHDLWTAAGRALTAELGKTARVGGALPDPRHMEMIRAVVGSWSIAAANEGRDLREVARERMHVLVTVRAEQSRTSSPTSVQFWAAPTFWSLDGIERDLAKTVDDVRARAARGRDGPGGARAARPRAHVDDRIAQQLARVEQLRAAEAAEKADP